MNIFLTGSTGFVGSNLAKRLYGHDIYCLKRGEKMSVVKRFNPDVIFHVAAELYDENKMFESNVKLTYDLLDCTKYIPYKSFVYVGSSSEYGRKNLPLKETDSLSPETMYEATKGAGSLLCQAFASSYDKPITIARPFSLYGIGQQHNKLMPAIYNAHKSKKFFNLSDGVHDWIYIDDFVDGLLMLMNGGKDIVNFGSGIQSSNKQVLEIFEKILNTKIETVHTDKIRTYDSEHWVCDTNYAKNKYGFYCKYSLEEGIKKYVEHRENFGN